MTYIPIFEITENILDQVIAITEQITRLSLEQPSIDLHLRKENRLRSIHSSLAIEANSLSLEQVTAVVNGKRVLGKPQEIREVQNAYQAYESIFKLDPYKVKDYLRAHGLLTADLVGHPGNFRTGDVGIFDQAGNVVHMGARPQYVPNLVAELLTWAKKSKVSSLIKSSVVHYELEKVHPFEDGNGRMGRLWQNLILSRDYPLFEYLPIETMIYKHQQDYYQALANNDSATDFIAFMLDAILETLQEYETSTDKIFENQLTRAEKDFYEQVKEFLFAHANITSNDAQKVSGKSSASVTKYFQKLVAVGLLEAQGERRGRKYQLAQGGKHEL